LFLATDFRLDAPFFMLFILRDFFRGAGLELVRQVVFFDFWDDFLAGLAVARRDGFVADGLRGAGSVAGRAAAFDGAPSSRQPWASRTEIMAARISFQVCGFIMTSLGNMHPSQQMWRIVLVSFPSGPCSQ